MSIREFYNDTKKNAKNNTELNMLYKKPVAETSKYMPKAQVFVKDVYYQADVLYMPEDKGFKYMLVCCDMFDGTTDAEPIKKVDSKEVLKAFKSIFKRKYLNYPSFITFDKGNEFNDNELVNYFKKNKTNIKYAISGRSRQLANVERANQKIATILFKRMASQELITGETSKEWVDDLKLLIEVINEHKKKPLTQELNPLPIVDKYSGNLLSIGQKVRLLLDKPINTTNNAKLYGKFRSTDIKWTPQIYKITEVLLKPGQVPLYLTDSNDNVGRTKNQLSIVKDNEEEPNAKYIRGNPEHYIISKIVNRKVENKKVFYFVKWKGYDDKDNSWVPSSELDRTKTLKEMKKEYNKLHNE